MVLVGPFRLGQDDGAPHARRPRGRGTRVRSTSATVTSPTVAPKDATSRWFQKYPLSYLTVEATSPSAQGGRERSRCARREFREKARSLSGSRIILLAEKPGQLSGGQRQAWPWDARSSVPKVFRDGRAALEPRREGCCVSDARRHRSLQADFGVTTVYVTHGPVGGDDARASVRSVEGRRLQQCESAACLYERPANTFVAGFIGPLDESRHRSGGANGSVSLGGVAIARPGGVRARLGGRSVGRLERPERRRGQFARTPATILRRSASARTHRS